MKYDEKLEVWYVLSYILQGNSINKKQNLKIKLLAYEQNVK